MIIAGLISVSKIVQDQQRKQFKGINKCFQENGMPYMILADNGNPWGACGETNTDGDKKCFTTLEKWFIQLI